MLAVSLAWNSESPVPDTLLPTLAGLGLRWSTLDRASARGLLTTDNDGATDDVLRSLGDALAEHHDDLSSVRADFCTAIVCRGVPSEPDTTRGIMSSLAAAKIGVEQVHDTSDGLTFIVADADRDAATAVVQQGLSPRG